MDRSIAPFIANLFLFTLTTGARAQALPPGVSSPTSREPAAAASSHAGQASSSANRASYSIRTQTPGKRFDVRTAAGGQVVARCIGQCMLALPLGSYEVHLYGDAGEPEGDTEFSVSGPGSLDLQDRDPNLATLGAVMGTGGIALIVAGTFLTLTSICVDESINTDDCPRGNGTRAALGLSSIALGAVSTPIGWVLFAHNRSPRAKEKPLLLPYATTTGDNRGGIIGFRGSF